MISFSQGQRNLLEFFHIDTSTALITKIALKEWAPQFIFFNDFSRKIQVIFDIEN